MPSYINSNPLKTMTLSTMLATAGDLGDIVYIPDLGIGGSVWFYNGSTWNAVNNEYMAYSLSAPVSHSGAFTEEIMAQVLFPAGSLVIGDCIETDVYLSKSGAVENCNYRHRFGPLGTTSDTLLGGTVAQPSGANRNTRGAQEYKIKSSTLMSLVHLNSLITLGTTASVFSDVTIDITVPNYLSIAIAPASALTETVTLSKFAVKHKTTR